MRAAALLVTAATGSASSWAPNFVHAGAWVGSSLESSPLWYRGKLYLMQSQMGNFLPDDKPHGFFCVFDGETGDEVVCPPSSSGHAFCSALVDSTPGRDETMVRRRHRSHAWLSVSPTPRLNARLTPTSRLQWVFCSAWDRANNNCSTPGWGCGACANPAGGCYVGSWNSSDPALQDWTFTQV